MCIQYWLPACHIFDDQVVDTSSAYGFRANSTTGGGLPLKVCVKSFKIVTWANATKSLYYQNTKQCANWTVTLTEKVILGDVSRRSACYLTARSHHRVQNVNEPSNNSSCFFLCALSKSPKTHYHYFIFIWSIVILLWSVNIQWVYHNRIQLPDYAHSKIVQNLLSSINNHTYYNALDIAH